jgi:hypothetical protein
MTGMVTGLGRQRGLDMFARWTDRIAAGELPAAVPPRPQGRERNVVLTMWDWGGRATFAHDELTTDKRNPTANAFGPIYGVDWGNDGFLIVDPLEHTAEEIRIPVLDPKVPPGKPQRMPVPSPYWGETLYWYDPAITNHAAMDGKGRVWMSSRFRVPENQPAFCATHPSAALAPQASSFRQVQYFDPKTRQFKQVNICFDTHHVQFDKNEVLYGNGVFSGAIGWIDTKILDATGDEAAAQGWCRGYHDINQDGRSIPPSIVRSRSASSTASFPIPPTAASGARHQVRCPARSFESIRRPASAKRTSRHSIRPRASWATRRAASTSIRTASSGRRSRAAVIWRASTAASAKGRCRDRRRPTANTAGRLDALPRARSALQGCSR